MNGTIVTFYSFKGGVGRSMALANIAVLLAKRGLRVLCVDFDLEAPGLDRYFASRTTSDNSDRGLIDLLVAARDGQHPSFSQYITEVDVAASQRLHLMTSGRRDEKYAERVLQFDWRDFFATKHGGDFFEQLRDAWRTSYDFVLIDSRTGLTDSGGICTVQMPDVLVPVFTTNDQSVEGVRDVVLRAQQARQSLAYDRAQFLVFPLSSRYDGRAEFERSREWLMKFDERLGLFLADWLPKSYRARQYFERVKVPYVAYFSFGENLPVLTHGTADPEGIGFAFEVAASLLAERLGNVAVVLGETAPTFPSFAPPVALEAQTKAPQTATTPQTNVAGASAREGPPHSEGKSARFALLSIATRATAWVLPSLVLAVLAAAYARTRLDAPSPPRDFAAFDSCIAAHVPDYRRDAAPSLGSGQADITDLPLLIEPAKRAAVDACAKQHLGEQMRWQMTVEARVTFRDQPVESELVRCASDACTTDSEGKCLLRLDDVAPGHKFTVAVQEDSQSRSIVVSAEDLGSGIHIELDPDRSSVDAIDGGPNLPPDPSMTPRTSSENYKDCLVRSLVNMIESGSPDKDYFVQALAQARIGEVLFRGGLYNLLQRYVFEGGPKSAELKTYLARVDRKDPTVKSDAAFRDLLGDLAGDPFMIQLSAKYLNAGWFIPVQAVAKQHGVKTWLGTAVLYDTSVAGKLDEAVARASDAGSAEVQDEKQWIPLLLKERRDRPPVDHTFSALIEDNNWELTKPIVVRTVPFVPACDSVQVPYYGQVGVNGPCDRGEHVLTGTWNCDVNRTKRVHCQNGVVAVEPCPHRCVQRANGVNDECE